MAMYNTRDCSWLSEDECNVFPYLCLPIVNLKAEKGLLAQIVRREPIPTNPDFATRNLTAKFRFAWTQMSTPRIMAVRL